MTSEDYMNTYEWDHEIELIIQDMREKLYDLSEKYDIVYKDHSVIIEDINE